MIEIEETQVKITTVSEARKHLPALAEEVARTGVAVLITRRGRPLAKLVSPTPQVAGGADALALRGLPLVLNEDFDEPLEDIWDALGR
jgi:prevent-host-death family protein